MVDNCFHVSVFCICASILGLILKQYCREQSMMLTIFVCASVLAGTIGFLSPLIDDIREIFYASGLDEGYISVIFKATAISLITHITKDICCDSGDNALGSAAEFFGRASLAYLSLPVLKSLVGMINELI